MKHPILCVIALCSATPAAAQDTYRDDRSTPQAVIESLYNAINAGQYLRAYSYFAADRIGSYDDFKAGYAETTRVTLRLGEPRGDGAAGTVYTMIPAVIDAVATDGSHQVFAGCYTVSAVSPTLQDTPPFVPLRIVAGTLAPSTLGFDDAAGDCAE